MRAWVSIKIFLWPRFGGYFGRRSRSNELKKAIEMLYSRSFTVRLSKMIIGSEDEPFLLGPGEIFRGELLRFQGVNVPSFAFPGEILTLEITWFLN